MEIFKKVEKNTKGRRLVIPDIHGCYLTFKTMVEEIVSLQKEDQLFLLGDYIDKGPDSGAVLDYILGLIDKGFEVYPLRGNHEQNLLYAYENYNPRMFAAFVGKMNKSRTLLDENGELIEKYRVFCEKLPYYYELDDFYLVHAGFDFKRENPFENLYAMIEIRQRIVDISQMNGKRIIHGHKPEEIDQIRQNIKNKAMVLPLDNGCVYRKPSKLLDYKKLGNLCCLNLDTFELKVLENMDMTLKS